MLGILAGSWIRWIRSGAIALLLAILLLKPTIVFAQSSAPPMPASQQPILPSPASQAPANPLQQQRQEIDQQKNRIQQERDRLNTLEDKAKTNLTGLNKTVKATTAQIQGNETNLKQAGDKLKTLEKTLAKAEGIYQQQQIGTVARLQILQRQRQQSGWAGVLLQSQTFNEFLDRRYRLSKVFKNDRQVMANLKTQTDKLEKQRAQVEEQKNKIALISQQLLAQKADYQNQAQLQQQNISRLKSDHRALEAAITILSQDSVNLMSLIRDRVRAEKTINREPGGVMIIGSGQLSFPVDAPITSEFGWRMHPILGYEKFHSGMDFGAEEGGMIRAAAAGNVILSDWYGGYGNTVIIDHGNGITTLYGHTEGVYVSDGQAVEKGEPIALVGSTGLSTGPHLHFEVRQDGEPIDPAAYL
jgi:murein DD-endopeptidase MepM/ murein hydrolase activator NlpD